MRYFFILGSNPTLSLAELAAIFSHGKFSLIQKNIAILEIDYEIKAKIIKKIGGVIKFGLIHNELDSLVAKDILKAISAFGQPEKIETKFNFGISFYGKTKINLKVLGMEFKKLLKQSGINSRWVISREPTLSSVVVEQNKLVTDRGAEIVMIEFNKKLFLGKTLAVQPFKELSFRDYGRPARDDYSGMLPPKLAQIMINLSGADTDKTILDPFCGSGTIITEALLMDYGRIIGSDISEKALQNTKTNATWIQSNFKLSALSFKLFHSDATQISKQIQPNSIDAIITEPYLGPQRGKIEIKKIKLELEKLYSESLHEFNKTLKPNGKIIMVWPVFQKIPLSLRATGGSEAISRMSISEKTIHPNLNGLKIINPIPENLQKNIFIKLTARNTIVYGREEQKVWREIVILEKIN
ncbi:methyltransferase domain-containing protein [Candidatus Falkowbacteria bacterium]|nr:methyltransferase domain-containing protein [Candidatus Falkowbacteria bacterium]